MKVSFPSRLFLVLIINSEFLFNDAKKSIGAPILNTNNFKLQILSLQNGELRQGDLHPVKSPGLCRHLDHCILT